MTTRCFASLAKSTATAVTIGASVLAGAATAAAYPQGDIFLADLESHGIYLESPEQAFKAARTVCALFAEGAPYESVIGDGIAGTGLANEQFRYFTELSVTFYCPEFTPVLPS